MLFRGISSRNTAVAFAYSAFAVMPLFLLAASSVRIQADLGFGTAEIGLIAGSHFGAGAVGASRVGYYVDRVGSRLSLRIGMVLSLGASGVVAGISKNWWMAALGMALCGLAHAFTQLALNRRILSGSNPASRATDFGLKQAAVPIAGLVAGISMAAAYPEFSWRGAYAVAAAVSLALALVAPIDPQNRFRAESATPVAPGRRIKKLAFAAGLAAGAGTALTLLLVDSFDANGLSDTIGAAILAIGSGLAAASRIIGGLVVDRRESDGYRELRFLLVAGAVGFGVLAVAGASLTLLTIGSLVAFTAGWGWQGIVFFTATKDDRIPPATASGVVLARVMSGSIVGPILIALIAERSHYGFAWAVAGGALFVSAAMIRTIEMQASPLEGKSTYPDSPATK